MKRIFLIAALSFGFQAAVANDLSAAQSSNTMQMNARGERDVNGAIVGGIIGGAIGGAVAGSIERSGDYGRGGYGNDGGYGRGGYGHDGGYGRGGYGHDGGYGRGGYGHDGGYGRGGYGHRPRPANFVCYAQNLRGEIFSAIAYDQRWAMQQAMDRCLSMSLNCRQAGCQFN